MTPAARDPAAHAASGTDLRQHHGVETPEHVELRLELAGVGSRTAAACIDLLVVAVGFFALTLVYVSIARTRGPSNVAEGWVLAAIVLVASSLVWAYFTLFEGLNGGRTPGKQALGL